MALAYAQALKAQETGEVPVGAVLVSGENDLLACGYNQVINNQDPCAHAEILVIREAAKSISNYRLQGCTLYCTLEPCAMCAGAIVHARIKRLVFACRDFKSGSAGSVCNLVSGYPYNHQVHIDEGLMQTECAKLLGDFFKTRR